MKIAVAPNLVKRQAQACTDEALAILRSCGCQAVLADGLYGGPPAREAVEAVAACDLLLAIGGDGTIICAAKIAASVDAGILGYSMYKNHQEFKSGDGIVTKGVDDTIANVGLLAQQGMRQTDQTILSIMTERCK